MTDEDYFNYVQRCTERVQQIMGSGRIQSEEDLLYNIEQVCMINNPVKAFEAFNDISPYNWHEVVDEALMKKFSYDLSQVVSHAYNTVITNDVLIEVSELCAYRFLIDGSMRCSMSLGQGRRVIFQEYWKSESNRYNLFHANQLSRLDGRDLALFINRDGSHTYILEHDDLSLVWISEQILSKPEFDLEMYQQILSSTLIKAGCPVDLLQNIEVKTVDDFGILYKKDFADPIDRFDLHEYHFVLAYIEDGVIYRAIGFNTKDGFETAGKSIVEFLINSQRRHKIAVGE